ncbi:sensor histidine kinase [Poseidonibacter lekithochrous]|uniref:sensor histidine kinase n=1 Tax=Poseidonibacter lekithochrous TaxID=1904463 RepID=UPI000D35DE78|nr:ATP-binding protein [Poseidonibacter lekithochrous]
MNKITEHQKISSYFFVFSLGLIITFVLVDMTFFSDQLEKTAMNNALSKIKEKEKTFSSYFNTPKDILESTRKSNYFNKYLNNPKLYKSELDDIFLTISSINKNIMQFRFIDKNGIEKIRIDRNNKDLKPIIVNKNGLQNKSNRYYFSDSKEKEIEKVWYSNIDLNMEKGKVIKPFIPTLRAMLPISFNNEFAGVLIINYFMADALNELIHTSLYDIILLNEKGDYLVHHDNTKNWSFYNNEENALENEFNIYTKYILKDNLIQNKKFISKSLDFDTPEKLKILVQFKNEYLVKNQKEKLNQYLIVSLIIVLLSLLMSILFSKYLKKLFFILKDTKKLNVVLGHKVSEKTKELQELNENLEHKVKEEIKKNKEKEEQLFAQAKLAAMGDMIGNIAHQWRQPLSLISTNASGIKLRHQFGQYDYEELPVHMDKIVEKTQYLSETIDTFRNFLTEGKEYKDIVLQDSINMALDIVNSSLRDNFIELENNINKLSPICINTISGELSEVIINVINNAKDVIIDKEVDDAYIKVNLIHLNKKIVISIEDNGGGIPDDIMPRIFEPYFTTKHKTQGTGLGLHMSYKIITDSLMGRIYAQNTDDGAKFFIELPLD